MSTITRPLGQTAFAVFALFLSLSGLAADYQVDVFGGAFTLDATTTLLVGGIGAALLAAYSWVRLLSSR